ncbi:MAG: hypothetical protein ABIP94_24725, partial [Planctomycetota bacterium]
MPTFHLISPRGLLQGCFLLAATSTVCAQCTTAWSTPQLGLGVAGSIKATTTWDPDGSGPQPVAIVIG